MLAYWKRYKNNLLERKWAEVRDSRETKNNVKFCVSSNGFYYKYTVSKLVESMLLSGVRSQDILIVVGGPREDPEPLQKIHNIEVIHVDYNALEFTALCYAIENNVQADWFFTIHDTCVVGPKFADTIYNYNIPHGATHVALYQALWAMNIGMLSDNYMKNVKKDFILGCKGIAKNTMISWEDRIFDNKANWHFTPNFLTEDERQFIHTAMKPVERDIYGHGTIRMVNYWSKIDLYKLRVVANNGKGRAPNGGMHIP